VSSQSINFIFGVWRLRSPLLTHSLVFSFQYPYLVWENPSNPISIRAMAPLLFSSISVLRSQNHFKGAVFRAFHPSWSSKLPHQTHGSLWFKGLRTYLTGVKLGQGNESLGYHALPHHHMKDDNSPNHYSSKLCNLLLHDWNHLRTSFRLNWVQRFVDSSTSWDCYPDLAYYSSSTIATTSTSAPSHCWFAKATCHLQSVSISIDHLPLFRYSLNAPSQLLLNMQELNRIIKEDVIK